MVRKMGSKASAGYSMSSLRYPLVMACSMISSNSMPLACSSLTLRSGAMMTLSSSNILIMSLVIRSKVASDFLKA